MDASPAVRRILLTGVTSSARLLVRHVLQSLGYLVDEAADLGTGAGTMPCYALVVAGPRALDDAGRLAVPARLGRPVPTILVGMPETARLDGTGWCARLAEPLDLGELLATVRSILDGDAAQSGAGQGEDLSASNPVDLERVRDFAGNDDDLVEELIVLYFTTARSYLAEMAAARASGADPGRAAHALKGASANFGAGEVAALALAAETGGVTAERIGALERAVERAWSFVAARHPGARASA